MKTETIYYNRNEKLWYIEINDVTIFLTEEQAKLILESAPNELYQSETTDQYFF